MQDLLVQGHELRNDGCAQASMLEIYNEEYKDLLGKALPAGKKHQVSSSTAHPCSATCYCICLAPGLENHCSPPNASSGC